MKSTTLPDRSTSSHSPTKNKKSFHSDLQLSDVGDSLPQNGSTRESDREYLSRPKYGKMIVLMDKKCMLITLGPDYLCSIFAIIIFGLLDYFTVWQVYVKQGSSALFLVTTIGSIIQVSSYLFIMFSNPGIVTESDFATESDQKPEKLKRFCNICQLPMIPRTRHCSDCNVCIRGYDHHCPWTSKCIGEDNLWRFYFFAAFTPLFLIYSVIVISLV